MTKLHLCCGDIYLTGYINIDIVGKLKKDATKEEIQANSTTLDKYFKHPFNSDKDDRISKKREFIIDRKENILEKWNFKDNSVDELVMISCFEHFNNKTEIPHIVSEVYRVLKKGGKWKFDFPDIKTVIDTFYYQDPEWCSELIYCNHKNEFSIHKWMYTPASIINHIGNKWSKVFCPADIVKHDYPMIGAIATK